MLRRWFSAALVVLVLGGFVVAKDIRGLITEATKDKITIKEFDEDKKLGEAKTYSVSSSATYVKRLKKKKTEDVTLDDLVEAIKNSKKGKGVIGTITVEDDKVTKVTFGKGGKGKKGKKKKNADD
jgi:hypothetical protein